MAKGYEVRKLVPVDPSDGRGATRQLQFPPELGMSQITIYHRRARLYFGQHVHFGADPSKNPEILFLASGRMRVVLVGLDDLEEAITLEEGDLLTIDPGVKHSMESLTDVVIVEPRRTHFDSANPDTVPC